VTYSAIGYHGEFPGSLMAPVAGCLGVPVARAIISSLVYTASLIITNVPPVCAALTGARLRQQVDGVRGGSN
jgi:hypothetical protein